MTEVQIAAGTHRSRDVGSDLGHTGNPPSEVAPSPTPVLVENASAAIRHWFTDRFLADLFAAINVAVVVAAAGLAKVLYLDVFTSAPTNTLPYLVVGLFAGIIVYGDVRRRGLYDPARLPAGPVPIADLVGAIAVGFILLLCAGYLLKIAHQYSRGWALYWITATTLLVPAWYWGSQRLFRLLVASGHLTQRVGLIREAGYGEDLVKRFRHDPQLDLCLSLTLDGDSESERAALARFAAIARQLSIDNVVVAIRLRNAAMIRTTIGMLAPLPGRVTIYNEFLSEQAGNFTVSSLSGVRLFDVQSRPLGPWSYFVKSVFDRVVATISIVLLAPVMAAAAIAIRLETPGPVLFRQRRHGFNEREIEVLKFRTMAGAEPDGTVRQAEPGDERITRVGRILRRTSIDELPQLFNVVAGEMSLVGPRPHALVHNEFYAEMLEHYANRHRVKPGITGWAQINGYRGGTRDHEMMRRRVECDLYYIDSWSIWLDLKILALTPLVVMIGRNAY